MPTAPTANLRWLFLAMPLLLAPAAARADAPVEPGRVYVGGDGVTIAVVPVRFGISLVFQVGMDNNVGSGDNAVNGNLGC